MSGKAIGLVIPTRWEAALVLRHFKFKFISRGIFHATIHGRSVIVCVSGVGRKAADDAAHRLVKSGSGELVSVGYCGALVPELKVGTLVTDRIVTVDSPARTPAERTALTQKANAIAVDMETRAVVEAGTRLGVPIRVVRIVSDEFTDDLTPLFGKSGTFSAWRIALSLFNPGVWPLARKLRAQSRIASQRLVEELERFFQAK